MKFRLLLSIVFALFCVAAQAGLLFQKFDKEAYYAAIKSDKTAKINSELSVLELGSGHEKEAYEGALLMRKAALVTIPAEKLKLFKTGRIKLETVLAKDSTNAEYRFLRLIIQEHAPKIVKYSKQLAADKAYIQKSYKSLSPIVQDAIADYSKSSKILLPKDL
jgi:hypothetical protein